jgi:hypothetical protein
MNIEGSVENNSYEKMKKAVVDSTGVEGTTGGKSNGAEATLRKGSLPKSSEVTTVDRDKNNGVCKKIASSNRNGNPKLSTASYEVN